MKDLGNANYILEMKILRGKSISLGSYKGFWRTPNFICLLHGSEGGDFCGPTPLNGYCNSNLSLRRRILHLDSTLTMLCFVDENWSLFQPMKLVCISTNEISLHLNQLNPSEDQTFAYK